MVDEEEETLECARFKGIENVERFVLQRHVCVLDDFKDVICSLSDFPYAGKFKTLIVGNSL
jgi:hypothetical protein